MLRSSKYQIYVLWFDQTRAQTHDLPHWLEASTPNKRKVRVDNTMTKRKVRVDNTMTKRKVRVDNTYCPLFLFFLLLYCPLLLFFWSLYCPLLIFFWSLYCPLFFIYGFWSPFGIIKLVIASFTIFDQIISSLYNLHSKKRLKFDIICVLIMLINAISPTYFFQQWIMIELSCFNMVHVEY
jgi:hypothetical protein